MLPPGKRKLKRNLFVLLVLLSLALIGTVIALPERFGPDTSVDGTLRAQTIDTLVARLDRHYVFPEKAKQIGTLLRQRQHDGSYDSLTDGERFAARLTADMASVAHDLHLKVKFSAKRLRPGAGPDAMTTAMSRAARDQRYGVDSVEHLGPAIGYLRISAFPPRSQVVARYAMAPGNLS
jgi:retinol-binding protein 3